MELPFPGDEVVKVWPPSAPKEEQARFIFRVPDYKAARALIRTIQRVADDEIETEDGWRVYVGLTLDRVENLTHGGSPCVLERDDDGALTEDCAARLMRFLPWLFQQAQSFIMLPEGERKNS